MKLLSSLLCAVVIVVSVTSHASNCRENFYEKGKWVNSEDIGVNILEMKNGLITRFTTLGGGGIYPMYTFEKESQGSIKNLTFKANQKNYEGKITRQKMKDYKFNSDHGGVVSIAEFNIENRTHYNVTCEGSNE